MAWLERRGAWEDRLVELERRRGLLEDDQRGPGTRVQVVVRDRAGA
jgi:hypothetical protein